MLQFSVTTHPRKSNESSPQTALIAIKNNFSAENAQSETEGISNCMAGGAENGR